VAAAQLVARLEKLADLVLALACGGRTASRWLGRGPVAPVPQRQPAAADLVVGAPGGRERRDRDQRGGDHDHHDDDADHLLHA
jgi:hypothetical protein